MQRGAVRLEPASRRRVVRHQVGDQAPEARSVVEFAQMRHLVHDDDPVLAQNQPLKWYTKMCNLCNFKVTMASTNVVVHTSRAPALPIATFPDAEDRTCQHKKLA